MDIASVGLAPYGWTALQSIPNKPLEYLAHGLALLSSLAGELAGIVAATGCGFTYAPGDVRTLKGHLARIAGDPGLRAGLRQRARATAAALFDPARVYADIAAHLEAIWRSSDDRGVAGCSP